VVPIPTSMCSNAATAMSSRRCWRWRAPKADDGSRTSDLRLGKPRRRAAPTLGVNRADCGAPDTSRGFSRARSGPVCERAGQEPCCTVGSSG
jgi:hypothetical protein